jgi:DNA-binding protein HU-beta
MVATVGRSVLNRCPTSADRHSEAFSRRIAEHDLLKKQAEAVLGDLVTLTTRHLKKGDEIRLSGLGVLQVRKRAARMGRNPATGEAIKIKASKKVAFRVAKELRKRCTVGGARWSPTDQPVLHGARSEPVSLSTGGRWDRPARTIAADSTDLVLFGAALVDRFASG